MLTESCLDDIHINTIINKKLKLKECVKLYNDVIMLKSYMNFDYFDDITVILKNIKTRHEYFCTFTKNNTDLNINLKPLSHLFTDYEGDLFIIIRNNNEILNLTPILIEQKHISNEDIANKTSQWYLRILDSGELRLSSIDNKINIKDN